MDKAAVFRKTLIKLILCAIFIALSYALANVKIPGTTIALDSLPAFLAALILAPRYGAAVGALGHLFSALLSGFPYTLPVHLLVALMMAVCVFVFAVVYRRIDGRQDAAPTSLVESSAESATRLPPRARRLLACVVSAAVAVVINGPVEVLVLSPLLGPMLGGTPGLLAFLAVLIPAAAANVVLALVVYTLLAKRLDLRRLLSE
jgi:Na+-transporting NADH:ubiquinone oxidoreductase subunit NqrB